LITHDRISEEVILIACSNYKSLAILVIAYKIISLIEAVLAYILRKGDINESDNDCGME